MSYIPSFNPHQGRLGLTPLQAFNQLSPNPIQPIETPENNNENAVALHSEFEMTPQEEQSIESIALNIVKRIVSLNYDSTRFFGEIISECVKLPLSQRETVWNIITKELLPFDIPQTFTFFNWLKTLLIDERIPLKLILGTIYLAALVHTHSSRPEYLAFNNVYFERSQSTVNQPASIQINEYSQSEPTYISLTLPLTSLESLEELTDYFVKSKEQQSNFNVHLRDFLSFLLPSPREPYAENQRSHFNREVSWNLQKIENIFSRLIESGDVTARIFAIHLLFFYYTISPICLCEGSYCSRLLKEFSTSLNIGGHSSLSILSYNLKYTFLKITQNHHHLLGTSWSLFTDFLKSARDSSTIKNLCQKTLFKHDHNKFDMEFLESLDILKKLRKHKQLPIQLLITYLSILCDSCFAQSNIASYFIDQLAKLGASLLTELNVPQIQPQEEMDKVLKMMRLLVEKCLDDPYETHRAYFYLIAAAKSSMVNLDPISDWSSLYLRTFEASMNISHPNYIQIAKFWNVAEQKGIWGDGGLSEGHLNLLTKLATNVIESTSPDVINFLDQIKIRGILIEKPQPTMIDDEQPAIVDHEITPPKKEMLEELKDSLNSEDISRSPVLWTTCVKTVLGNKTSQENLTKAKQLNQLAEQHPNLSKKIEPKHLSDLIYWIIKSENDPQSIVDHTLKLILIMKEPIGKGAHVPKIQKGLSYLMKIGNLDDALLILDALKNKKDSNSWILLANKQFEKKQYFEWTATVLSHKDCSFNKEQAPIVIDYLLSVASSEVKLNRQRLSQAIELIDLFKIVKTEIWLTLLRKIDQAAYHSLHNDTVKVLKKLVLEHRIKRNDITIQCWEYILKFVIDSAHPDLLWILEGELVPQIFHYNLNLYRLLLQGTHKIVESSPKSEKAEQLIRGVIRFRDRFLNKHEYCLDTDDVLLITTSANVEKYFSLSPCAKRLTSLYLTNSKLITPKLLEKVLLKVSTFCKQNKNNELVREILNLCYIAKKKGCKTIPYFRLAQQVFEDEISSISGASSAILIIEYGLSLMIDLPVQSVKNISATGQAIGPLLIKISQSDNFHTQEEVLNILEMPIIHSLISLEEFTIIGTNAFNNLLKFAPKLTSEWFNRNIKFFCFFLSKIPKNETSYKITDDMPFTYAFYLVKWICAYFDLDSPDDNSDIKALFQKEEHNAEFQNHFDNIIGALNKRFLNLKTTYRPDLNKYYGILHALADALNKCKSLSFFSLLHTNLMKRLCWHLNEKGISNHFKLSVIEEMIRIREIKSESERKLFIQDLNQIIQLIDEQNIPLTPKTRFKLSLLALEHSYRPNLSKEEMFDVIQETLNWLSKSEGDAIYYAQMMLLLDVVNLDQVILLLREICDVPRFIGSHVSLTSQLNSQHSVTQVFAYLEKLLEIIRKMIDLPMNKSDSISYLFILTDILQFLNNLCTENHSLRDPNYEFEKAALENFEKALFKLNFSEKLPIEYSNFLNGWWEIYFVLKQRNPLMINPE